MSKYLNNKEHKREILKRLIKELHNGRDFDEVKKEFGELVEGVEATEIADMEQQLINEGLPPEEIKKLCDVHAALFRDTLKMNDPQELIPGHPLHTLKYENDAAGKMLDDLGFIIQRLSSGERDFLSQIGTLKEKIVFFKSNLDRHYSKKENIFFPYLEKHNITGPPSVMWSVDDEIRAMIKAFIGTLDTLGSVANAEKFSILQQSFLKLKDKVVEMFFKEENILTPMMKDALTEAEWVEIKEQIKDFGPSFTELEEDDWKPGVQNLPSAPAPLKGDAIELDTGTLTPLEINTILKNLPVDITFVGKDDTVRYFSLGKDRIFTRTKSIIGRKVQNCHPPESVHVVEKIISDFKSAKHNTAEFWLELNGAFIHIRYFALRDENGEYLGTMEVSQDLTRLRALEGERRLLQYKEK